MLRLVVVAGPNQGAVVDLTGHELRIGRSAQSDLILSSPDISGRHAVLAQADVGYVVRDVGSTNGTRVIRDAATHELGAEQDWPLRVGDRIEFGKASVGTRVELEEVEAETSVVSQLTLTELQAAEPPSEQAPLTMLFKAQRGISAAHETREVFEAVADATFALLARATHVTVALAEERNEPRYVVIGTRVREGDGDTPVPITRSVYQKVVRERSAVLSANAQADLASSKSLLDAAVRSTIGVPLWQGEEIVGVLQIDNRTAAAAFDADDLALAGLLAQAASQAFARARLMHDLRTRERQASDENAFLKEREEERRFGPLIVVSEPMKAVMEQVRKVADTNVAVLIQGETGTGKELVACAVHYWSDRRKKLLVAQNCAALPENLLESELFGHKKGAFTGAYADKKGLFELAHEGTLFLDEVGEMPAGLQAKLLRVLQEKTVRPIGAQQFQDVDVRIVAATNRDLEKEVAEGRFREDLFYRLNVFPVVVPPIRERSDDTIALADHFLKHYAADFGRPAREFSQTAVELLRAYRWPGNVRELQNEVQRAVIEADGEFVEPQHLSQRIRQFEHVAQRAQPARGSLKEMIEDVEKWLLRRALEEHDNNKSATAKTLGITREGLHKKLKNYGM